MYLEK